MYCKIMRNFNIHTYIYYRISLLILWLYNIQNLQWIIRENNSHLESWLTKPEPWSIFVESAATWNTYVRTMVRAHYGSCIFIVEVTLMSIWVWPICSSIIISQYNSVLSKKKNNKIKRKRFIIMFRVIIKNKNSMRFKFLYII